MSLSRGFSKLCFKKGKIGAFTTSLLSWKEIVSARHPAVLFYPVASRYHCMILDVDSLITVPVWNKGGLLTLFERKNMLGEWLKVHLISLPTSKNITWHPCIYSCLTHINIYVRKKQVFSLFFSIFLSNVAIIHYKNSSRLIRIQVFVFFWPFMDECMGVEGGIWGRPQF